jgi:hypothetical protein
LSRGPSLRCHEETLAQTIDWRGQSAKTYRYWFLGSLDAENIKAEGGNHNFVRQLANGNWTPVYFGESGDLRDRIPGHELSSAAVRLGATHVMAHITPAGEEARLAEERELIAHWNPPLNMQHRSVG